MINERIAELLAALKAEGVDAKLIPGAVVLHVGMLEVDCPGRSPRPGVRVVLDGRDITRMIKTIVVRLVAGEFNEATLEMSVLPPPRPPP